MEVYDNQNVIGALGNNGSLTWDRDPGKMELSITQTRDRCWPENKPVCLDVVAGKTYKYGVNFQGCITRSDLTPKYDNIALVVEDFKFGVNQHDKLTLRHSVTNQDISEWQLQRYVETELRNYILTATTSRVVDCSPVLKTIPWLFRGQYLAYDDLETLKVLRGKCGVDMVIFVGAAPITCIGGHPSCVVKGIGTMRTIPAGGVAAFNCMPWVLAVETETGKVVKMHYGELLDPSVLKLGDFDISPDVADSFLDNKVLLANSEIREKLKKYLVLLSEGAITRTLPERKPKVSDSVRP
jgi:hypothetical protein